MQSGWDLSRIRNCFPIGKPTNSVHEPCTTGIGIGPRSMVDQWPDHSGTPPETCAPMTLGAGAGRDSIWRKRRGR
jgi:hypothetical protein